MTPFEAFSGFRTFLSKRRSTVRRKKQVDQGKTHIKKNILVGPLRMYGGYPPPPTQTNKQKLAFFYKSGFFSQKIGEKKDCKNPFQAIIRL